jgi:hypothetical protein
VIKSPPHRRSPLQRQELDVLVPEWRSVIHQPDIAKPGMILAGDVELMLRAVGSAVGNSPLVQVHPRDVLAVEHKVGPGLAVDQHIAAAAMRIEASILNRHLAGAAAAGLLPVQALAVE